MPVRPVTEYLETHNVHYHCYNHPPAVTAQEIAESVHISGALLAKTVIVNSDGVLAMAVLPANRKIDLQKLRTVMSAEAVRIANEYEFSDRFPLCETGGVPPLGDLYGMEVFMEQSMLNHDWIAFNAGTHTEIIKMDTGIFRRLVQPVICNIAEAH